MDKLMKIELSINIENELEQRAILDALGGINHRLNVIRGKDILELESELSIDQILDLSRLHIDRAMSYPESAEQALNIAISDILSAKAKIKEKEKDGITFQL